MAGMSAVLRSRMGRRVATAAVLAAVLPLLLASAVFLRDAQMRLSTVSEAQLRASAESFAHSLEARLSAAESLSAAIASADSAASQAGLRAAIANTGIFERVVFDADNGDRTVTVGALLAAREPSRIFIARPVVVDGHYSKAYFFLRGNWLWANRATPSAAAVLDADGKLLHNTGVPSAELASTLSAQSAVDAEPDAHRISWHADGSEWLAVVSPAEVLRHEDLQTRWQVIAYQPVQGWASSLREPLTALAIVGVLAIALATWLALRAASRHLLPLVELQGGLLRLGLQRFAPLRAIGADEISNVVDAFNSAGNRLEARVRALETLRDIDHLLLGATDLEPALDAILSRVQTVTRCQTVGIALLDRDSPHLGRIIAAAEGVAALPVSRIEFDQEMYQDLLRSDEALTVARCEEVRHSFLAPLRAYGGNFFWVWPVRANNRLAAVLVVGFSEAPAPEPSLAENGAQFAARLAFAVSKTQRDEQLYRQAHFDALTALPNRLLFHDRLAQELASATASQSRGALLYIDLDHFKKVNDSVGHAAGDQLLTIVAQRLRAAVKEGDTVARLAGDEFTVILRQVAETEGVSLVAQRIIEAMKMPVNISGRDHFVAASIGITLFPDDGSTIEELMHNADSAMYRAKESGRGRAVFFDRKFMVPKVGTTQSGLYRALRRREFSLFYQPQFNVADGGLVGLEALLRWNTPRDGTRQPNEFIPAAEASGLIVDIGSWVLETACAQMSSWQKQGIAPSRLSINVSAQQLKFADFPRIVRRTLEKFAVSPELLEIEVTESVFSDDVASAAMTELAAIGVRIALDDFDTGHSSLNYLRQYPIQVVKIDRAFIQEISNNPASGTLASTIVTMAHALGKQVVAEGVETEAQLSFLREHACDFAQGFYLSHPQPVESITEMLQLRVSRQLPSDEAIRQTG